MSSRRQRSNPLGGRYRKVSLYHGDMLSHRKQIKLYNIYIHQQVTNYVKDIEINIKKSTKFAPGRSFCDRSSPINLQSNCCRPVSPSIDKDLQSWCLWNPVYIPNFNGYRELSWCQLYRLWRYPRLSLWQLPLQPAMAALAPWQLSFFSDFVVTAGGVFSYNNIQVMDSSYRKK